ncbi:hypothetical protein SS50377_22541 [Spironucleus salmonicida]|nr:hypothetical protein SS50377_22541 [Spironucleus salmonicida]
MTRGKNGSSSGYVIQTSPFENLPELALQQQSEQALYQSLKRSQYSQMSFKALAMSLPENEVFRHQALERQQRDKNNLTDVQNRQLQQNALARSSGREGFTQGKIKRHNSTIILEKFTLMKFEDLKERFGKKLARRNNGGINF